MNPIEVFNAINVYIDRTQSARFYFSEVNQAVNDAAKKIIDSITDTDNGPRAGGIDRLQMYRDNLFPLIKNQVSVPSAVGAYNANVSISHINYPTDYQAFAAGIITIDGNTTYLRETNHNEIGPLLECSFRAPNNNKPYFLEDSTGFLLYSGYSGTVSSCTLTYIKQPNTFYMGNENDLIGAGTNVLIASTSYTVFEDCLYSGNTYYSGSVFTTTGVTDLVSGHVIKTSIMTNIDLPTKLHDDVSKMAASILQGTVTHYEGANFSQKESGQ